MHFQIISEFLISKDKPVSSFKRTQPNMLLMQVMGWFNWPLKFMSSVSFFEKKNVCLFQKFAHEKMEWPKHYTSEKVLVLMTYAELMNRKYHREVSSQIKPLR